MLLVLEVLLLILAALEKDHRAAAADLIYPLDMAPNSVDDQYNGCREKMSHLVQTEFLENEINNSTDFKTAWRKGEEFVKRQTNNLTRNHLIAIYVYSDALVYPHFNSDTRCDKKKYKKMKYKWYSLHFLLTEGIQILKETQKKCFLTYRGTKGEFEKNVLSKTVRFGSFASSSLERKVAVFFGNVTCFEIETCNGAVVANYSKLSHEKEVLIPPYEIFKVTDVRTRKHHNNLWCDTVFTLKTSGHRSDLNCALFKKPTQTISKYTP